MSNGERAMETDPAADPVLAIDVGGTKIAAAVVTADGTLTHERRTATMREAGAEETFAPAAEMLTKIISDAGLSGPLRVGIGSAGPMDGPRGLISPVNIAAWRDFPIVERVRSTVRQATGAQPTVGLAGDGHCMALGEHWLGAGRGLRSMVGMVLSTGVGAGAVIDDQLYAGDTGNAVLIGHISVNAYGPRCVCGSHGCVEMYARGPALVQAAKAAGWAGGDDAVALTASARAGDPVALEVFD
jgi:glucokinase